MQRPGAGAVYLNIFHSDVLEFLDTKKINADEDLRLATISTGLIIPGKFFDLVESGEDFYVFKPYSVFKEYGEHLDDIDLDEMYDKLVQNKNVEKIKVDSRQLLTKIAQTQLQSGYPYLFYKDNSNNQHPLKSLGDVKMSNLCTEIMQLQETSEITDYGEEDIINRDVLCNLGSLNIVNVMERKNIQESVYTAMDALTTVSDTTDVQNAPGVEKANAELHAVGLGAMNLHGYLVKNKINYESPEAKDFVRTFFSMVNYYSIEQSMKIAKSRNKTFKDFEKSDYGTGEYFKERITEDYKPKTTRVKELFEDMYIPDQNDWKNLSFQVQKYGMYNAYRLAIAPTQSISYIQNATSSVMPIVELIERRAYGNAETYYPAPFLSPETQWYYKSAFNTNMYRHLELISEIQRHVDQGISTILYVDSNVSTRELSRMYVYAHKLGLKSLYYTRTKLLDVEECISCAV